MNKPQDKTYPQTFQATPKGQEKPVLQVTQIDGDSFRVDLPNRHNLGLATNFCSKEGFFSRYDLVEEK